MDQYAQPSPLRLSQISKARDDFQRARRRAALEQMLASMTGKSIALLPYNQVREQLKFQSAIDRGTQEIPLHAIVGSVSRYEDFTRSFLPTNPSDENRWASVKSFMEEEGAPPIEVYQIGDAYFVLDGNHRVSIARQSGLDYLPAHVTEVKTRVPFSHHDTPTDLVCKARYAEFLDTCRLDELRPGCNLLMTLCDQYDLLLSQIEVHRFFTWQDGQDMSHDQVICDWYDHHYLPVVQMIREVGILLDFPDRTETDLYILVTEHRLELEKRLGWEVDTSDALVNYAQTRQPGLGERLRQAAVPQSLQAGPQAGIWRRQRLARHDQPALFVDILVLVLRTPGNFNLLDGAILVAQREAARLHGLEVHANPPLPGVFPVESLRAAFEQRCRQAAVAMKFSTEKGPAAQAILQRAALADLLVLPLPESQSISADLYSARDFDQVLHQSARPILAIPPSGISSLDRAVLAYDGSQKAEEALYAAAYLALRWEIDLTVVCASPQPGCQDTLEQARDGLDAYRVEAEYIGSPGNPAKVILQTAASQAANLIIIGGHGQRPLVHRLRGSTVHDLLEGTSLPVLICC